MKLLLIKEKYPKLKSPPCLLIILLRMEYLKLGDPEIPTIPCSIKINYVKTSLCDLGAGVSVMPFSLYKRLDLNKLTPTEISLQMNDKSTSIPIGICEDVLVVVANVTILTDFVILKMPEDDNMLIILGRPLVYTSWDVITRTRQCYTNSF